MSDLLSLMAMSEASDAADSARGAKNAAEERLEGKTSFVSLKHHKLVSNGLFSKDTLDTKATTIGLKKSDISYMETDQDYPNHTVIVLEDRCNYSEKRIYVKDSIDFITKYINNS